MSTLLGITTDPDTDMGSSYEYDFAGPMISDAVQEDFDIDLTFEDPVLAQNLDAEMDDSQDDFEIQEADMKDHHDAADEPIVENLDETIDFEYAPDDLFMPTPKSATPKPLKESLDMNNTNAASTSLSPNKSVAAENDSLAAGVDATAVDEFAEDEGGVDGSTEAELEGKFDENEEEVGEEGDEKDAGYSHHEFENREEEDDHVIFEPADEEAQTAEHEDTQETNSAQDPFPATTADKALEFFNQEEATELTESVLKYRATVQWQDYTVPLFPNPSIQSRYFSTDLSLLDKDISNFFRASRDILKSQVGDNKVLELNIPQLDLAIDENSYDCAEGSILQILQLYYKLHNIDGVDEPEPLHIILHSSLRYSARIGQLLEAAEASKGYAELLGWTRDDVDDAENADFEQIPEEEDDTLDSVDAVADEDQTLETDNPQEPQNASLEENHESNTHGKEHATSHGDVEDGINNAEPTVLNEEKQHPVPVVSSVGNAALASEPAFVDETDEIDYADTDNHISSSRIEEAAGTTSTDAEIVTGGSSTTNTSVDPTIKDVAGQLGHDLNTIDDDAASDFHIDIFEVDEHQREGFTTDGNDGSGYGYIDAQQNTGKPAIPTQLDSGLQDTFGGGDEFELEVEEVLSNDSLLHLGKSKSTRDSTEDNAAEEEDELIDWDDEDLEEPVTPKASVGSGPSSGSPLGKRSREEHAESLAEADAGQEAKRVKA